LAQEAREAAEAAEAAKQAEEERVAREAAVAAEAAKTAEEIFLTQVQPGVKGHHCPDCRTSWLAGDPVQWVCEKGGLHCSKALRRGVLQGAFQTPDFPTASTLAGEASLVWATLGGVMEGMLPARQHGSAAELGGDTSEHVPDPAASSGTEPAVVIEEEVVVLLTPIKSVCPRVEGPDMPQKIVQRNRLQRAGFSC